MPEPLVRIDGLTKRFGPGPPALDAVSGAIGDGAITGLVGPDGAGKTTLIRIMAGLVIAEQGSLEVLGLDPTRHAEWIHASIGYMPQRFGLYEDLSVGENLRLYADLRGLPGAERTERFEQLLSFTDLKRFTSRRAGKLSGGMKQKLGLACALVRKPRLLAPGRAVGGRRSDLAPRALANGQWSQGRGRRRGLVDLVPRRGGSVRSRPPAERGQASLRRSSPGAHATYREAGLPDDRRRRAAAAGPRGGARGAGGDRRCHPGPRDSPRREGRGDTPVPAPERRPESDARPGGTAIRGLVHRHPGGRPRRAVETGGVDANDRRLARAGHRRPRSHQAVRRLHGRRGHLVRGGARGDLRPARSQRSREVDDVSHALRAAEAKRGRGSRRGHRSAQGHRRGAEPPRIHGAEVLALRRPQRGSEPLVLRGRLRAHRQRESASRSRR